jgi:hypothetical protein
VIGVGAGVRPQRNGSKSTKQATDHNQQNSAGLALFTLVHHINVPLAFPFQLRQMTSLLQDMAEYWPKALSDQDYRRIGAFLSAAFNLS